MRNPFVAVDAATDLRSHARVLRHSWERAMGDADATVDVRPVIGQSWRRLVAAGLDPDHLHPARGIDHAELEHVRAASPLSGVIDVLRRCLVHFADDAEHVMVVVDDAGRILWLEGHNRVRQRADRIAFGEGMFWTEEDAGTNAIGTALAIDHAVQIFSAEHFLAEQHPWWCSAAPIHDPVNGRLLGIVDLSGPLRTAHPHSLALVMAAAGMAEDELQRRQAVEDERLRRAFLEHAPQRRDARTALLAADGRVLLARPAGWIDGRVDPPCDGRAVLADGSAVEAEPLDGGSWVVREAPAVAQPSPAERALRLELLGHGPYTMRLGEREPLALSVRHAEILALLAMHPDGLSCEQLTLHLYGELGVPVSTRAEVSRLRRLVGPALTARPYRLNREVVADFLELERRLARGDVGGALDAYKGPLLPSSQAPRIEQARDELERALARAARGTVSSLWRWLQTESGREDADATAAFIRAVPATDPRRPVAAARLRSLQVRWQAPEPAAARRD